MAKILVAEDDRSTNKLLCAVLRKAGHEVTATFDGQEALDALDEGRFDLLVTDVMMPRVDGVQLVRMLREARIDLPVLMLTAKTDKRDVRGGFVAGADDYLTKPADVGELVLRVKALLRRAGAVSDTRLAVGATTLDANTLTVTRGQTSLALPPKEFQLLFRLLSNPGQAFTRMQLLEEVWGWDSTSGEATVNVHVNRLRSRFEGWGDFEIQTVRGIGYRAVVLASEADA